LNRKGRGGESYRAFFIFKNRCQSQVSSKFALLPDHHEKQLRPKAPEVGVKVEHRDASDRIRITSLLSV
jgi:hypothetical protein